MSYSSVCSRNEKFNWFRLPSDLLALNDAMLHSFQALGLLEDLAKEQAADVALRLRDPRLHLHGQYKIG